MKRHTTTLVCIFITHLFYRFLSFSMSSRPLIFTIPCESNNNIITKQYSLLQTIRSFYDDVKKSTPDTITTRGKFWFVDKLQEMRVISLMVLCVRVQCNHAHFLFRFLYCMFGVLKASVLHQNHGLQSIHLV